MKTRLQDINVDNKTVIVRCDFNVPMKNNEILDDNKIRLSLKTINYLVEKNCKIIILSHFGKVKTEDDKKKYSLAPIAKRLNELVSTNVIFSTSTRSTSLIEKIKSLNPKDVILLENTRFEDVPNKLESNCDPQLSEYWASLADIFVMDAFGSAHRKHSSTYGIALYIPSCIGFLVQTELMMLQNNILHAKHPFTILMGGAKLDDKLELMEKLLPKCDFMILTGGLANTCLKVLNINIGSSLCSTDQTILDKVKNLLIIYKEKIILPLDAIVGSTYDKNYVAPKNLNEISENESIYDIGPRSIEKFKNIINQSTTIFMNGTAGLYEEQKFSNGTQEILSILKQSGASVIVGGGDSVSAVHKFGYANAFTYLSSGGGATLEYLVNESLPALESIQEES